MQGRLFSTACFVAIAIVVSGPGRMDAIASGSSRTSAADEFRIAPQTTGGDIAISSAGAAVSGHVTDAASTPVSSYSVIVFSTDRGKWSVRSQFVRLARPTQDGSFEVTGLSPGEYFVAATEPVEGNEVPGEWLEPDTLERLSFRATRVTLADKERLMTVLRLIRR